MTDEPVTKREVDVRFAHLERSFAQQWIDAEKAVRLARDEINRRIDTHDRDLREIDQKTTVALLQTREREVLFHTRAAHDEFNKTIEDKIISIRNELKPKYGWLASAASAILLGLAYLWNLSVKPTELEIVALKENDKRLESLMDAHFRMDQTLEHNNDQTMSDIIARLQNNRAAIDTLQQWLSAHESQKPPARR